MNTTVLRKKEQAVLINMIQVRFYQFFMAAFEVTLGQAGLPLRQFSSCPTRQAFGVRLAEPEIDSNNPY